ncbi:MAG: hypothetical protein QM704_05280 [Anaeromyxobacteraceae bacterium]
MAAQGFAVQPCVQVVPSHSKTVSRVPAFCPPKRTRRERAGSYAAPASSRCAAVAQAPVEQRCVQAAPSHVQVAAS